MPNSVEMEQIIKSSLYTEIPLDDKINRCLTFYFDKRNYNELSVDMYCPQCGLLSTFKPFMGPQIFAAGKALSYVFFQREIPFGMLYFCCARDSNHVFSAQIIYGENKDCIKKIGQNPSVADIDVLEFNKFRKILPNDKLLDLKRSVGLASHGIGVGSFVYLRRVFEYLLMSSFDEAERAGAIDSGMFRKAHVSDKIKMLKDYLPEIMVENAQVYGILSKGVHELDEETCLKSHALIKETIVFILEEMLLKKEKEDRRKNLSNEISRLGSRLTEQS